MKKLYDTKWDKARRHYLNKHPLCAMCHADGRVVMADVVDHIKPHKRDMKVFWDSSNWQSLCFHCHNSTKQRIEKVGYDKKIGLDGWPVDPNHPNYS